MKNFDYTTYLSPFTWRYGSKQMREIWSEVYKRKLWRQVWVALAKAQHEEGLVSKEELDDLQKHKEEIDVDKAHEIEAEVRHDLMAEVKTYAQQAKTGGGKIHLGATSMDIEDNADTVRILESLVFIEQKVKDLLTIWSRKIDEYKDLPCMAYTHLQPAEPTTLGYRFAFYAQDILLDLTLLRFVIENIRGKGMKGAVGTAASYTKLLNKEKARELEQKVMDELHIDAATIANQTAPRKYEWFVSAALTSIAQSLYKFAFDLRIMQSPGFGEWQEPFGKKQIGSSAMPFKRNPWKAEQICSLGRLVFNLGNLARDNSAHMLLERTLDDSANRRVYIPEMFLATDEMLGSTHKIVDELVINEAQIKKNLDAYGPFAATESVLMEAAKKGGDRQELHEILRTVAMESYEIIAKGEANPLLSKLQKNDALKKYLDDKAIEQLMYSTTHIGIAKEKCDEFLQQLKDALSS